MARVLNVGIIGAGRISDLHALGYRDSGKARISAVCDLDIDSARRRAETWGVPATRVFREHAALLALPDIDLVEILLPHDLHAPVTLDALSAGKHVSVQKPMATNLADADRMIDAAARAGLSLRVYENALFFPPVAKARALIDEGAIGEPLSIRIKANKGDPRHAWEVPLAARAWRQDAARSGGGPLTFDDGHHKFAIAWHFMGPAQSVHAWIEHTEIEPGFVLDCPAQISWRFDQRRYGNLEVVYSPQLQVITDQYAQHDPVEITGSRGVIQITCGHARIAELPPVLLYRDGAVQAFADVSHHWADSFIAATRHHIDALHAGSAPLLSGAQGREILRFCLAAQRSAQLGRDVALSEVSSDSVA